MAEATLANPLEKKGLAHIGGQAGLEQEAEKVCPQCSGRPVRLEEVHRKEDGTTKHVAVLRCGRCGFPVDQEPSTHLPLTMTTNLHAANMQDRLIELEKENAALKAQAAKKLEPPKKSGK